MALNQDATHVTVSLQTLDAATYGPATAALQEVLGLVQGFEWFPVHADSWDRAAATDLIDRHLTHLRTLRPELPPPGATELTWLQGPLDVFDGAAQGRYELDTWGDPWIHDQPWGAELGAVATAVNDRVERTPTLKARVQPPLWPRPGVTAFVRPLRFEPPPPRELQANPRWAMMNHVQHNLWCLFEWAVAYDGALSESPFYSLLQLHRHGCYPLGYDGRRFLVFHRIGDVAA